MALRLKRAWLPRAAVAAAVFVLPLLASSVAQAALAGAPPASTTNRPDLRSASIANASANTVDICFDRSLTNTTVNPANFVIGGYRSANRQPATSAQVDQTNTNCVLAYFANGDLNQFTYVETLAGGVTTNTLSVPNLDDSVAFTDSLTHNGTTGLTSGPDLVGILTPSSTDINTNRLEFVEDQNAFGGTGAGAVDPTGFFYDDSAGNQCFGTGATVSANVVVVSFPVGGACATTGKISNAVRGGQEAGSATASADPGSSNTDDEVAIPGAPGNGATTLPDLTTASLNGETVSYTFDQQIATATAARFFVALSDGIEVPASTATVTGPNTVTAVFNQLSTVNEYAVKASVAPGAVTSPGPAFLANSAGSTPIGGNAGAFARGFTTGPDVFGVVFHSGNSQATIDVDQRVSTANAGGIFALNSAGNFQAHPTGGVTTNAGNSAGPSAITAQFAGGALSTSTMLQVTGIGSGTPAFDTSLDTGTFGGGTDGQNVSQVVSAQTTAARLQHAHWHSAHATAKQRARSRANLLRKDRAAYQRLVRKHKK